MDGYLAWLRSRVGHDKIQLVFAVACVLRDDDVLLQHRADTGGWGFPGGALELGETAHDAAIRETREETGVPIAITQLIGVYTDYEQRYPNGDIAQPILIAFRAAPLGDADRDGWLVHRDNAGTIRPPQRRTTLVQPTAPRRARRPRRRPIRRLSIAKPPD